MGVLFLPPTFPETKRGHPLFPVEKFMGVLFLPMNGNSLQRYTLSLHSDTNIINRLWIWVSMPGPQPPYLNIRSIFKIAERWLAL